MHNMRQIPFDAYHIYRVNNNNVFVNFVHTAPVHIHMYIAHYIVIYWLFKLLCMHVHIVHQIYCNISNYHVFILCMYRLMLIKSRLPSKGELSYNALCINS